MQYTKGSVGAIVSIIIFIVLIGFGIYYGFNRPVAPADTTSKTMQDQTAQKGDMLTVNYTGKLTDGTVFDSNVDPKFNHVSPFKFTVGAGQVIAGWDEGFLGMKAGEKKTLTVSPEKGYGAGGHPPVIPPNATLIFDVELVAIN